MKQIISFGTTQDGSDVAQITIGSDQLAVKILTLGGVLNDVRLTGIAWPLTLGSTEVAAYEGRMSSFGSLMGPVINRIKGCSAELMGRYLRSKNTTLATSRSIRAAPECTSRFGALRITDQSLWC